MSEDKVTNQKLILVLGGARAGKSTHALQQAAYCERAFGSEVCFIATAQGLDEDMTARIGRHRSQRPSYWHTIEEAYQIDEALQQASNADVVIVDCLTLFVSNWLMRYDDEQQCESVVTRITKEFLRLARSRRQMIICVSNEVGLGVVPDTRLGRVYRDLLGRVNQDFAAAADEVYLLVAGLPLRIKPTA